MSDSCGYIALSHPPSAPRIILAFRGTYSVANTIIDLSTVPQEYVPYPGDEDGGVGATTKLSRRDIDPLKAECTDCTVHMGFMRSWQHTRPSVLPQVEQLKQMYPDYQLTLVGHSLGGAVAALASLEFQGRGWNPQVTTFGEPRVGNQGLTEYFDKIFVRKGDLNGRYRRVTHVDDPVPLLPLTEWGYTPHAGEVYISKPDLSPEVQDVHSCSGDTDPDCIAGAEVDGKTLTMPAIDQEADLESFKDWWNESKNALSVPARWRIWQLFFAHRDYFWRLGLCIPGGDPKDWYRKYPHDDVGESPEL